MLVAKLITKKLVAAALAAMLSDMGSTMMVQSRDRCLPPRGTIYLGTDNLYHMSPGRQRDLTLGYPSNLRISLEVPIAFTATSLLVHKFPRAARRAYEIEIGVNAAGTAGNLYWMPKSYVKPK